MEVTFEQELQPQFDAPKARPLIYEDYGDIEATLSSSIWQSRVKVRPLKRQLSGIGWTGAGSESDRAR